MTEQEILNRIALIEESSADDEHAHIMEDRLWEDFLKSLSERKDNVGKLAKLVLTTSQIEFSRWYA